MIKELAKKLTEFMISQESIIEDESEIYQYGVEITLSSILNITLIMLISIITGRIISGAVFLGTFIIMRRYCGGYHARSYLMCNIIFAATFIAVLIFSEYVTIHMKADVLLMMLSILPVFIFAPVPNENKPLTVEERTRYSRWSLAIYVPLCLTQCICSVLVPYISRVLFYSLMAVSLLIMVEVVLQMTGIHKGADPLLPDDRVL